MSVGILAANGMLGTGFRAESFHAGLVGADAVGCDAGSSDYGPYYLGSGQSQASRQSVRRDLELMLDGVRGRGIPLVIASAGTAGAAPHVDWTVQIVEEICAEHGWHLPGAVIYADVDVKRLSALMGAGRVSALPGPPLNVTGADGCGRVVAMMGAEPIREALRSGAQIVVAGRCSDSAIYAAPALELGAMPGPSWHAGKILECGAAATESRLYPDCLFAELADDAFAVEPPNPLMRCTPSSVAAHSLYENVDPDHILEPGGSIDTSACSYTQSGERAVQVTGSRFAAAADYTVKLEGSVLVGYRSVIVGGITDPGILGDIRGFVADVEAVIVAKVRQSLGYDSSAYTLTWRTYGAGAVREDGPADLSTTPNPSEIGLVIEVIAATQRVASDIMSICAHTTLHQPLKAYEGFTSNIAFPFSPPDLAGGPVYNFTLNHIAVLTTPTELFRTVHTQFGGR